MSSRQIAILINALVFYVYCNFNFQVISTFKAESDCQLQKVQC